MIESNSTSVLPRPQSCGLCCTRLINFGVILGNVPIIEKINLHVHCGELTVIIGPNGAGKTTLLKAILGELPHNGRLSFIRSDQKEGKGRPLIGYVPQKFDLDAQAPVSVMDLFAATLSNWPVWLGHRQSIKEIAARMLASVQAAHLADKCLGKLSCGQLQRVLLALALTPTPDILLLDEPTSGMDPAGAALFYGIISQLRHDYDLSIILVSHDLAVAARFADRLLLLNRSIICDGPPEQVLVDRKTMEIMGYDLPLPDSRPKNNFAVQTDRRQKCDLFPKKQPHD